MNLLVTWKKGRDILNGVIDGKNTYNSLTMAIILGVLYGWGGSLLFHYEAKSRGRVVANDLVTPSMYVL